MPIRIGWIDLNHVWIGILLLRKESIVYWIALHANGYQSGLVGLESPCSEYNPLYTELHHTQMDANPDWLDWSQSCLDWNPLA
jgi:hypothetical protein